MKLERNLIKWIISRQWMQSEGRKRETRKSVKRKREGRKEGKKREEG